MIGLNLTQKLTGKERIRTAEGKRKVSYEAAVSRTIGAKILELRQKKETLPIIKMTYSKENI